MNKENTHTHKQKVVHSSLGSLNAQELPNTLRHADTSERVRVQIERKKAEEVEKKGDEGSLEPHSFRRKKKF